MYKGNKPTSMFLLPKGKHDLMVTISDAFDLTTDVSVANVTVLESRVPFSKIVDSFDKIENITDPTE